MKSPESNFLKTKYDLHNTPETKQAAKRTEVHTGEKVPQDPIAQIDNYLHRFREITDRTDPEAHKRGVKALEKKAHELFVIQPEEVPESYFALQQRIAREQGHGNVEINDEARAQMQEAVITDQASSLDTWIEYFSSPDSKYFPDAMKYWVFRSMLKLSIYDKEKHQFDTRGKGTTAAFPDLDREALAYVGDVITKKIRGEYIENPAQEVTNDEFKKVVASENFGKLYAFALEHVTKDPSETLENTAGEWKMYPRGDDYMPLVKSLQGHGTGWCTAGESFASAQLQGGDFYVYYSYDKNGKPTIPRVAIRMENESIAEVRGIAQEQNLDPYIGPVVQEKLKQFPDGEAYEKKVADMRTLTTIERKVTEKTELTIGDLRFLYEVDAPIEGFGYEEDPRIVENRNKRDQIADIRAILEAEVGSELSDNEFVQKATERGMVDYFPLSGWDLRGLTKETALVLLKHEWGPSMVLNLESFNRLDEEVVIGLLLHHVEHEVITHIAEFDVSLDKSFVKKLIDSELFGFCLRHTDLFPQGILDAEIASTLIEKWRLDDVANNITSFHNLTPEILRAIFRTESSAVRFDEAMLNSLMYVHDQRTIFDMSPKDILYEYLLNRPDHLRKHEMNFVTFPNINYDSLAKQLIREDRVDKIGFLLPGLKKSLPEQVARNILLNDPDWYTYLDANQLAFANVLTQEILFEKIDKAEDDADHAMFSVKYFKINDYDTLVNKFIANKRNIHGYHIWSNFEKYLEESTDLEAELRDKLLERIKREVRRIA